MTIVPPYLKQGDTIAIVCPAGYLAAEKAQTCIQVLGDWGFNVKVGKTLGHQFHYFAGTDAERLQDFQQALNDDSVQAILCGRGGYGVSRMIDDIEWTNFKANPKWIIGFSDITVFHSHLLAQLNTASIHSSMAAAFDEDRYKNEYIQSIRKAITGEKLSYTCNPHAYNKTGEVVGQLVGGNLSLLAHLVGSVSDIDTNGKILFIEDIGEYIYNADRMLIQLERAGKFKNLKALIIGGFTDMKDTTIPFGQNVFEILRDKLSKYDFPVCYDFPVSHDINNYALKIGVEYKLAVQAEKVTLAEI